MDFVVKFPTQHECIRFTKVSRTFITDYRTLLYGSSQISKWNLTFKHKIT